MISESFFHTICFPWMLLSSDGKLIDLQDGTLFKLPDAAKRDSTRNHCLSAAPGWSCCPNGFAVYSRVVPALYNAKLIVYGLKVPHISKATGKSDILSIKTNATEIERYLNAMFSGFAKIEDYMTGIIGRSAHEVRGINTSVKRAVEDILRYLSEKNIDLSAIEERVNNIKALSEILSASSDFLDYFVNPALAKLPDASIRVYNKFFKTVQCLSKRAADKDVGVQILGHSVGAISGLRVFEVIPFILVENAIKYSPGGREVEVILSETATKIEVLVKNWGPQLENDELDKIFEVGARGKNAAKAGISGFGFGLPFVRELVERHHKGTICFRQIGPTKVINSVEYVMTEVALAFDRVS